MSYDRSPVTSTLPGGQPTTMTVAMQRGPGSQRTPSPLRASAVPSALSSGYTGHDADSEQGTDADSPIPVNTAEPWKQTVGGLVAPRTFAARFFVTRLGFMRRKCRRMMAFTTERMYVVKVEDGRAKASFPIKSVVLAPSDKVNQGKGIVLTSEIGNVRHQYKCRDRTSLLAAFYELQDAARDRPFNLLFQVVKRSKTRGDVKMTLRVGPTSLDRVDGERLQNRVSSLPLLSVEKVYLFTDDATQIPSGVHQRVSTLNKARLAATCTIQDSYLEGNVKKILVDCYGGRRRRYWCAARDSLVKAIEDNLRKLGRTSEAPLNVERVGSWEVDTSSLNPVSVKKGYLFEVPVQKWSRTERAFKNRLLAITRSSVVEMDVATREHLREFPLAMILNVVYHNAEANGTKPTENTNYNKGYSIEVQTAWGMSSTYTFQACRCAAVSTDSIMAYVAVSEEAVTPAGVRQSEDRRFRGSLVTTGDNDNFADTFFPMGDGVCGFHDLRLTAMEARVHFLSNFLEVCRLNHHGCPWSLRRVTTESRVGELSGGLHPDYQEFLLKRTTGLSAIARAGPGKVLADLEAKAYAIAVLDELNASTPVAFEHKEKGAATAVLSMLSPSALQHFDDRERVCVLQAVLRLLWSKTGYEEVTRTECQPAVDGVFRCLGSEDHTVSYTAALVIRSMLTHPRRDSAWWVPGSTSALESIASSAAAEEGLGADRKLEKANRKALFGQGNEKHRLEKLLAPLFGECMKPEGGSVEEDFGSDFTDSEGEDDDEDGQIDDDDYPMVTMAGVGPPPTGPDCIVQAVLMEVLLILVSSGDKQADRAVVEAVWDLLHEFDAMCRLLANLRSPCLPLAKASMQLLGKMHHSKRFSVGPRSILQDTARDSGMLLWVIFLAMDTREQDMARVAGRLLRSLTDGDARSLGVLTRSFPPGLLSPSPPDQLFNECGAAVWGTSSQASDAMEFNSNWDILHKEVRNVEVVWSPVHRNTLGRLLLEQLQDLERETRRGVVRRRGGRAPAEALAWNDAAWEVPWHNLVGEVKVGRYYLEQLIVDLDSSQEGSIRTRKQLENPAVLGDFLQLCHLRLLHERDASSLELVFDTMTCLFQHLGSRAVPMLSFLGSILHMLTYSLPAILGPVGAGEEEALEDEAAGSGGEDRDVAAEPRSGAQATATYYAAVQFVRVCLGNQPANVRLFVMHGGVETFVELLGSAFQHARSLSASSSAPAVEANGAEANGAIVPSGGAHHAASESEEDFSSTALVEHGAAPGSPRALVPRRERASDMSVALTCRELVVECISCLSSALEVFPAQDMDGKMFFPKPPPKRQLANTTALAALADLLASEEEAVLHPALTLLVTVVRGGLEVPLSSGSRGRIVVRCLRHACEGRCPELCAELLGAEAVAAPPSRLSDGGTGGAVGPASGPREGAILARSPLYPLLPGALVRLMVTKGARAFAEALLADGLETPTVVWNSECRHMLGTVLRELEGLCPGLQDVPAEDVQEAGRRLDALYSERGGIPVLYTSPYYVQLIDEEYRVEYPAPFLHEIAASITEVLQGPPELLGVRGRGRQRCISTLLENEGDVIYLHEPLVWTLRQHAGPGATGSDSLARAVGAVVAPLVDITARVAIACSHSPEALTSVASFAESLSLALGFLARVGCLSAYTASVWDGAVVNARKSGSRRCSRGPRRRSSVGMSALSGFSGRRKSLAGGPDAGTWTVAVDLSKLDALLTMLKQLDDQESAGHLINAGNHVLGVLAKADQCLTGHERGPEIRGEIPGLTCYVSGLVSALVSLEAPAALLAATEGIGLSAVGVCGDGHVDLLYKSQVFVPLISHCIRPQVSEDRPGGHPGLGLTSARTLGALGGAGHAGMNAALSALLTSGGLAVLRRSPEEFIRVLRTTGDIETPRLVWGPHCRNELEELINKTEELLDEGGHRGPGAAMPIMPSSMRRLRRFKPRELDGFVFPSLQDELVVDDVYLRVLVKEAIALRGTEAAQEPAGSGDGLGRGLALPSDLLASVFVYLGDQMRLIASGQIPNVSSDRQLFFQDVALLLQALIGLSVGEQQVPEVIEDSGEALHLMWASTPPYLKESTPGPSSPVIARSVVQLMHVFLTRAGSDGGQALVASGAVAPAVHACSRMLVADYDNSPFLSEDGVAALHVCALLLDAHPHAAKHMVGMGAVPLFLSRASSGAFPRSTRVRCAAILHHLQQHVPAAGIALARIVPEVLMLHLEGDVTGDKFILHMDGDIACPILVWDEACRDRLSTLTWEHWDEWKARSKIGASLRWVPTMLPEELLLPEEYATEPCVAGVYFRIFAIDPGFVLEKDMVEDFLACSIEAMKHGKVADDLLPVLLKALYFSLASLGDGALAGASRKANDLWPIVFSLIWKELGLGQVRYDPSARPKRVDDEDGAGASVGKGNANDGETKADGDDDNEDEKDVLSQGEAILRWGSRVVCLLVSVPVHWTVAGAATQILSDEHALALVHSPVLDAQALRVLIVMARAIVTSKADEAMDVAHYFASPLVLRSLVDRLATYKVSSSGSRPGSSPQTSADVSDALPPASVTQDLVMKLLASLMVHPQQGQRTRLVLKDELPDTLYMALHQAGSEAADIKANAMTALPSIPDRDIDHKIYPKKKGSNEKTPGPVSATGTALVPESLNVPLTIVVTVTPDTEEPMDDEDACVNDDRAVTTIGSEARGEAAERPFIRESRALSLKRSIVAALSPSPHHQRAYENARNAALINAESGTPGGSGKGKTRERSLWHRGSAASTAGSPSNNASSGTGTSSSASTTAAQQPVLAEDKRPMTLPSPNVTRGRTLGSKRLSQKAKPGERASTLSPSEPVTTPRSRTGIYWAAVAAALSPGFPPSEQGKADN